jgi:glycerol kinase
MEYILAIDQGTTKTMALIIDRSGQVVGEGAQEIPQHFKPGGFVEHDGNEIKKSVKNACLMAINQAGVNPKNFLGIGITNQRETVCLFDKDANPIFPFIVWQCRRSKQICLELRKQNLQNILQQKTGLTLDPYFSASKLLWIFREVPEILLKAQQGQILFGTVDTFLTYWLSGNELYITDATNASRTMLMDIHNCQWSDECLELFSVPKTFVPQIVKNLGPFGKTKNLDVLPDGIPILALAGDQQAALFGQTCFDKGETKATFGTGSFILINTGHDLVFSKHGLISSVAFFINERPFYCLEGSSFIAGALMQFCRDNLGLVTSAEEIDELAQSTHSSADVLFIPALCGLSSPHWLADAKGMICGLDRATDKTHIARAALEGIALQNTDIMLAMAQDGIKPLSLKVDGGAAKSNLLMQIHADLLGIHCIRPEMTQKTALGVAFLAGLAAKVFNNLDDIRAIKDQADIFAPNPNRAWAIDLINRYHQIIKKFYL